MKSSLIFILAICSIYSSVAGETSNSVNWRYDNDTIPEMLPRNMLEKSKEEIEKAVFNAYQNQIKVVSEYSGHVYDPEFPLGYLKDECHIPDSQTYGTDIDLIFENNVLSGLRDYFDNVIIIKWAPDQIETIVKWKDVTIRGNYHYLNPTLLDQGNYHITVKNFKYQATTTLTENTMKYPSSVPSSSISYTDVDASFSGKIPTVTNINDSHNLKFFLEEVVFQHVADNIVKSIQPNISIAIRQGVRPYIMFKNVSDPHFKGFTASTPSNFQLKVDDVFTDGLNQTLQRVKNMTVDMANKKLMSSTELVMHSLSGTFRVKLTKDTKEYTNYATFKIENINVAPISNMFSRDDCTATTTVKNTKVTIDPASFYLNEKEELEVIQVLENEFSKTLKNKFEKTVCIALADMLNSKAGNF